MTDSELLKLFFTCEIGRIDKLWEIKSNPRTTW